VVEGTLYIDIEEEGGPTIELGPKQGVTITKGMMHRPRAPKRVVMLMVETANIVPTGD
jgi:mannose-6-phosphate isomerase-like protein (cupin superfamily)